DSFSDHFHASNTLNTRKFSKSDRSLRDRGSLSLARESPFTRFVAQTVSQASCQLFNVIGYAAQVAARNRAHIDLRGEVAPSKQRIIQRLLHPFAWLEKGHPARVFSGNVACHRPIVNLVHLSTPF